MKKVSILMAILAVCLVGCGDKNSYKVNGTVANAEDGEVVFMHAIVDQEIIKVDSATIKNNKFTFTGKQDSTVNRYLTYESRVTPYMTDMFLENGNITVLLAEQSVVKGTSSNDIYQTFKDKVFQIGDEQQAIYRSLQDPSLTDDEREAKIEEIGEKDKEASQLIYKTIADNINNPVGIHLLTSYNYLLDFDQVGELIEKVPAGYKGNEVIQLLDEQVTSDKRVAIGNKFTDLEMQDPQGKPVKLSDYVNGKNKYILIDFWASWCGPCRVETPYLVELYKEYHKKGVEIVGISFDRSNEDWIKGIDALEITWPQMSDLKMWDSEGAVVYAVRSIPYTILLDGEGTIIEKGLRGEALLEKIGELLK